MLKLTALLVLALTGSALADEPRAPKMPPPAPEPHVSAFGQRDKACTEWSDGCTICLRPAGGAAACSTPGIACVPGPTVCRSRN